MKTFFICSLLMQKRIPFSQHFPFINSNISSLLPGKSGRFFLFLGDKAVKNLFPSQNDKKNIPFSFIYSIGV